MKLLPVARTEDIVIQEVDQEILIYDLKNNKAFCLNETSSIIFQACSKKTSFDELKRKHKFSEDIIFLALDELRRENLLAENQQYNSPFAGMSRREAIRKVAFASVAALPVIAFLVAPTAVMSASACRCVNPGGCLTQTSCPSTNNCNASGVCAP
jgi:hypothetical protein